MRGADAYAVIRRLSEYFLPGASVNMWSYVCLAAFLGDAVLMQYLFCVHLFVDPHVPLLMSAISRTRYCGEAHDISSFFWIIVALFFEYGGCCWDGRPRSVPWKASMFAFGNSVFLFGLVVATREGEPSECSAGGVAFAAGVGALLGLIKVYAYAAICEPLVRKVLRRETLERARDSNSRKNWRREIVEEFHRIRSRHYMDEMIQLLRDRGYI